LNDWVGKFTDAAKPTPEPVRTPQGERLVKDYVDRFSDSTTRLSGDPLEEIGPEAGQMRRNREELRARQGGVGLPSYKGPGAPLRSALPGESLSRATDEWTGQESLPAFGKGGTAPLEQPRPGAAPVLEAPIDYSKHSETMGEEDALAKNLPFPRHLLDSEAGEITIMDADGKPTEQWGPTGLPLIGEDFVSPRMVADKYRADHVARPNEYGVLSKPTVGERLAVDFNPVAAIPLAAVGAYDYIHELGASAGNEMRGLEPGDPGFKQYERTIPKAAQSMAYKTGRFAASVPVQAPGIIAENTAGWARKTYDAVMNTPYISDDPMINLADSVANGLAAATGMPKEWFQDSESETAPLSEDEERLFGLTEKWYLPDPVEKMFTKAGRNFGPNVVHMVQGIVQQGYATGKAIADPSMGDTDALERVVGIGGEVLSGMAGSMIRTFNPVTTLTQFQETPVDLIGNMLMANRPIVNRAQASSQVKVNAARQAVTDAEVPFRAPEGQYGPFPETAQFRDVVKGTEKNARVANEKTKTFREDLDLANFFDDPMVGFTVDAVAEAKLARKLMDEADAAVQSAQGARPIVSDVLHEVGTKSEAGVPSAYAAKVKAREPLAEAVVTATQAELVAAEKAAAAQQALRDHIMNKPVVDWSEVRRENFKSKIAYTKSAGARPTKNRGKGEATFKATERREAAKKAYDESLPWFKEANRLKAQSSRLGKEAAAAKAAAKAAKAKFTQSEGVTQAEIDAVVGRAAVREGVDAGRAAPPKIGALQEVALAARKAYRESKAVAKEAQKNTPFPSVGSRGQGQILIQKAAAAKVAERLEFEAKAAAKAVENAGNDWDTYAAKQLKAVKDAKAARAASDAMARPAGIRNVQSTGANARRTLATAKQALDDAKVESAAATQAATPRVNGPDDFFDVSHNPGPKEFARVTAARNAEAAAQAAFDAASDGVTAAEAATRNTGRAHLAPELAERLTAAEDAVATVEKAAREARETAKATGDPNAVAMKARMEGELASRRADLATVQSEIRNVEAAAAAKSQGAQATVAQAEAALQIARRDWERRNLKLEAQRRLKEGQAAKAAKDAGKITDPVELAEAKAAEALEALEDWTALHGDNFKAATKALAKADKAFASSENMQWLTTQVFAKMPTHLATGGLTLAWEAAKLVTNKLISDHGQAWLRNALRSQDGRIPEALADFMAQNAGRSRALSQRLEQAVRKIPDKDKPTVRNWMWMEHAEGEGGWWRPGNFNWDKSNGPPGHWSTYDRAGKRWVITKQGLDNVAELERIAAEAPGTPEAIAAADKVARFNAEFEIANKYGRDLAMVMDDLRVLAAELGLPGNDATLRPIYLPQALDKSVKRSTDMGDVQVAKDAKARINARMAEFTDGPKEPNRAFFGPKDPNAPVLLPDLAEYKKATMRDERIGMDRRINQYGVSADLGQQVAAAGRLVFDIQMRSIYNQVAKQYGRTKAQWRTERGVEVVRREGAGVGDLTEAPAADRGWKLVDDDPATFGEMAGKVIPEDIYYELASAQSLIEQSGGWLMEAIRKWKGWRTVHSPTTQARNFITGALVFAPMAGISLLNPGNWGHYANEVRDWFSPANKRSAFAQEMVDLNVSGGSVMKNELTGPIGQHLLGAFERGGAEPMKAILRLVYEGPRALGTALLSPVKLATDVKVARANKKALSDPNLSEQGWIDAYNGRGRTPTLDRFTDAAEGAVRASKTILSAPSDWMSAVYQASDQLFKGTLYRKMRTQGMSPADAAREVKTKLPDYSTIPGFAHLLRVPTAMLGPKGKPIAGTKALWWGVSAPFFAYTATAIPIFMNWAKNNPAQGAMYLALHDALTNANLAESRVTKEERDALLNTLPGYRKGGEMLLAEVAPEFARNERGDLNTASTRWWSPFESLDPGVQEDASPMANALTGVKNMSGAAENAFIVPLMSIFYGIDVETGQRLYSKTDPNDPTGVRVGSYITKKILPPWMWSLDDIENGKLGSTVGQPDRIGGGSWIEQLAVSASGKPDITGRPISEDQIARTSFGLKGSYVDATENVRNAAYALNTQYESARLRALQSTSKAGMRLNELVDENPGLYYSAIDRIMTDVAPAVRRDYRRTRALKSSEVAQGYADGLQYVLSALDVADRWKAKGKLKEYRSFREEALYRLERVLGGAKNETGRARAFARIGEGE
jgi:hypothetical protein